MMELNRQSPEVYFASKSFAALGHKELKFLKDAARVSVRQRCRICLHVNEQAELHQTVLVYTRDTFNRPNRHPMAESFHILEGTAEILLFDDDGTVRSRVTMGDQASGLPFLCQFPLMVYHTIIVRSKWLVIYESCRGPFVRGKSTLYAPWAPEETDSEGIVRFYNRIGVRT